MKDPWRLRLRAMLALGGITTVVFAGAASAGQAQHESLQDEGAYVIEDYCGVAGLDVRVDFALDARLRIVPRGSTGLAYFLQVGTKRETITNLANGRSLTTLARVLEKDMQVTDNGDGTLTVLALATGNATLYGSDGRALARNPGQVRFELLVDHGGTPADPSDDENLEFLGVVKPSTGRSDDFCEAAVPALT